MAGWGDDQMGPTSAKFDPEMGDKDGQNPIQTAEIFAAPDARDRADTSALSPRKCSRSLVRPSMVRPSVRPRPNPKRRSPGRKRRQSNERQIAKSTTSRLRTLGMLTISKPLSASQAQTYHAREFASQEQNYWSRDQQGHSEWQGRLAEQWGLQGGVGSEHFARLSEGQHPHTEEELVRHQVSRTYEG